MDGDERYFGSVDINFFVVKYDCRNIRDDFEPDGMTSFNFNLFGRIKAS